jgi:hypothetical protein
MTPWDSNILVHLRSPDRVAKRRSLKRAAPHAAPGGPLKVGIWDLGAWLGNLPGLLDKLNAVQAAYRFFTIEATVPVGMIRRGEGVVEWLRAAGKRVSRQEALRAGNSLVAEDYYAIARPVRQELGVDYLVGITPSMVADHFSHEIEWDYFSTFDGRLLLASTADLRRFSSESGIPFDRFLGAVIVAQLLVAQFLEHPGLGFHMIDRGCLFDRNDNRETLKNSMRDLRIEPECMAKIGPAFRQPAAALVNALSQLH